MWHNSGKRLDSRLLYIYIYMVYHLCIYNIMYSYVQLICAVQKSLNENIPLATIWRENHFWHIFLFLFFFFFNKKYSTEIVKLYSIDWALFLILFSRIFYHTLLCLESFWVKFFLSFFYSLHIISYPRGQIKYL